MMKWLRRIAVAFVGLVVVAVVLGAVAEQLTRHRIAREFPPPGKMVDIGGRRIQLDCRGAGSPVVVFESGFDTWGSLDWSSIQDEIAKTTRACSYSRAGLMWSDPAPGPRNGQAIVSDLRAVLGKAGEHPPFVLVGHSLGGAYVVAYTTSFGADVAGLVLVDPAHPNTARMMREFTHRDFPPMLPVLKLLASLSWTGVDRLYQPPGGAPNDVRAKGAYQPTSAATGVKEGEAIDQTLASVGMSHDLGKRPLYVLTATVASEQELRAMGMSSTDILQFHDAWRGMHDDIATWSSNSQHLFVPDSGHFIQSDKPEVVVRVVNAVIDATRSGEPLKPIPSS